MPIKRTTILGILLLYSGILMSQSYEPFITLLNENFDDETIERNIESFFKANEEVLSNRELAECYHDRGGRWHYSNYLNNGDIEELDKAIFYTNKALEIKRRLTGEEICAINRTLYNLGLFHYDKGLLKKSLSYYGQLLIKEDAKYCINKGADYLIDWALLHSTTIHMETGDYLKARDLLLTKIRKYEKGPSIIDDRPFWFYYKLSELYMAIDLFANSDNIAFYLSRAQKFLDDNKYECCFYQNRIDQLNGNRLSEIKDYKGSIKKHLQVVANLDKDDSVNLAIAHNSLGHSYFNINETERAFYHLNEAISYDLFFDSPYNNLGDIYLDREEFHNALMAYQKAINKAINKKLDLSFDQLPTLEQLSNAPYKTALLNHLIYKANAWISYYEFENKMEHLTQALETFTLADKLVDLIREVSNEEASELYWREQSSALYMKAVEVCFLLNQSEKAYYFMERNKALLLLEDLGQEEAKVIAQIPPLLGAREFTLKRQIFLAENTLFESEDDDIASMDSLKLLVNENKYTYQNFIDSLNTAYPDYAKYKRNPVILTYDELASKYLTNEKAVVHYILNEEDGYGLLTTNEKSILFRLEHTNQLNTNIEQFNALLVDGLSDLSTLSNKSHSLFTNIMPAAIYEQIKGKQLIIVPDYTLQRLPFETLIADADQQKYLLEDVEISYVYSMSLLDHNQGLLKNTSEQFLGVAPVNFEPLGLAALNSSQGELEGIADYFNSEVLLNTNATKDNFLSAANSPKIIHLATHADVGQGENPWIAFSDEKMYLKEIYAIKTASDMVVLSACNTSDGNLKRGEGVMSLARGFFYSGAKSVVSSLWPVNDESGKELMISFYKNLDKGYSKSRALREAKLSYLNNVKAAELKHPFYWAGFVMLGDNAALVKSSVSFWSYTGIVVLLVLIFFFRKKLFKRLQ